MVKSWGEAVVGFLVVVAMSVGTGVTASAADLDEVSSSQQGSPQVENDAFTPSASRHVGTSNSVLPSQTGSTSQAQLGQFASEQGETDEAKGGQAEQGQQAPDAQSGQQTQSQDSPAQSAMDCAGSGTWSHGTAGYSLENDGNNCTVHITAGVIALEYYNGSYNQPVSPWSDPMASYTGQNITKISFEGLVTFPHHRMDSLFEGMTSLRSISGLSNVDTTGVTSFDYLFKDDENLQSLDLGNWNTTSLESLSETFRGCGSLSELKGLAHWNLNTVTTTSMMFYGDTALASVGDLSSWRLPNVRDMSYMFNEDNVLSGIGDLGDWSVATASNANNMAYMFAGAYNLDSLDMRTWNIPAGTNMTAALPNFVKKITFGERSKIDNSAFPLSMENAGATPDKHYTGNWAESLDDPSPATSAYSSGSLAALTQSTGFQGGTYVWQRCATVVFDKNAEDATGEVASIPLVSAEFSENHPVAFEIPSAAYTRSGYSFTGWTAGNSSANKVYRPGEHVYLLSPTTVTFYAQWAKIMSSSQGSGSDHGAVGDDGGIKPSSGSSVSVNGARNVFVPAPMIGASPSASTSAGQQRDGTVSEARPKCIPDDVAKRLTSQAHRAGSVALCAPAEADSNVSGVALEGFGLLGSAALFCAAARSGSREHDQFLLRAVACTHDHRGHCSCCMRL